VATFPECITFIYNLGGRTSSTHFGSIIYGLLEMRPMLDNQGCPDLME